jgi:hypothetical protein
VSRRDNAPEFPGGNHACNVPHDRVGGAGIDGWIGSRGATRTRRANPGRTGIQRPAAAGRRDVFAMDVETTAMLGKLDAEQIRVVTTTGRNNMPTFREEIAGMMQTEFAVCRPPYRAINQSGSTRKGRSL